MTRFNTTPLTGRAALTALFVAAMTAAAVSLTVIALLADGVSEGWLLAALIVAAIMLELRPIDISLLGPTKVSLMMVPLFAAALLLGAGPAALVAISAPLAAHAVLRRVWYKAVFNASVAVLTAVAAATVFEAVSGSLAPDRTLEQGGAAALAAVAAFFVNTVSVAAVVSISTRVNIVSFWRRSYLWLAPHYLTLYFVGFALALSYRGIGLVGVITYALPVAMIWVALRQFTRRSRADLDRIRAAEAALRVSEERYRSLVETTTRGIFVANRDGRIMFHNGPFASLVAHSSLDGCLLDDLVVPADRRTLAASLTADAGHVRRLEIRVARDQADDRLLALTLSPYGDSGQILGEAEDITERHALEARVQHAQRMDSVGNLAAGISHDFNNLLTVVLANLEAALATRHAPTEPLHAAMEATRSASELSQQLLAFGRAKPQRHEPVLMTDVVSQVARLLNRTVDQHISVHTDVAPGIAVLADAGQLKQVILNLAINGRDAIDGPGALTVRARLIHPAERPDDLAPRDEGYVLIEVTDTGSGMDQATAARMFEPFFTTKRGTGTGLGCAVVFGIIREHHGLVTVDTTPGVGTTICVFLPTTAAPPARLATDAPAAAAPRGHSAKATPNGATILVIDDLDAVRRAAAALLRRAGYTTLEAASGEVALKIFAERRDEIDAILLDLSLPGITGRETYDTMRAAGPMPPTAFMSGYADDALADLPHGPDWAFVQKPFDSDTLIAAVESLLDARTRGRSDPIPA